MIYILFSSAARQPPRDVSGTRTGAKQTRQHVRAHYRSPSCVVMLIDRRVDKKAWHLSLHPLAIRCKCRCVLRVPCLAPFPCFRVLDIGTGGCRSCSTTARTSGPTTADYCVCKSAETANARGHCPTSSPGLGQLGRTISSVLC